jgi:uncharacterized Zn-binding protein involved in type VI secretion
MTDLTMHDNPHCHAPIHPPAPTPTPVPHPSIPMQIIAAIVPTVIIEKKPAAVVTSITEPCKMPACVPAGPGVVAMGSTTVFTGGLPAARLGDLVTYATCVAPIPAPTGKIIGPCAATVIIGG